MKKILYHCILEILSQVKLYTLEELLLVYLKPYHQVGEVVNLVVIHLVFIHIKVLKEMSHLILQYIQ